MGLDQPSSVAIVEKERRTSRVSRRSDMRRREEDEAMVFRRTL